MSQANCACLRVAYRTEESRPGLIVRAWWACDLCDRVFTPVLPPLPAGLDFEKAHTDLWAPVVAKYGAEPDAVREYISPGLQRVLNAQVAERIAEAVAAERAETRTWMALHDEEQDNHADTKARLAALESRHAALRALVKEWQEARKAKREYDFPICYDFGADPVGSAVIQREKDAEAALAAFDLGKEGADA